MGGIDDGDSRSEDESSEEEAPPRPTAEELGIVFVDWGRLEEEYMRKHSLGGGDRAFHSAPKTAPEMPHDAAMLDVHSDDDGDPLRGVPLPSEEDDGAPLSAAERFARTLQRIADCKIDMEYLDDSDSDSFIDDKEDIRANAREVRSMLQGNSSSLEDEMHPDECLAAVHVSELDFNRQKRHKQRLDDALRVREAAERRRREHDERRAGSLNAKLFKPSAAVAQTGQETGEARTT
jgi:hypothetical protein